MLYSAMVRAPSCAPIELSHSLLFAHRPVPESNYLSRLPCRIDHLFSLLAVSWSPPSSSDVVVVVVAVVDVVVVVVVVVVAVALMCLAADLCCCFRCCYSCPLVLLVVSLYLLALLCACSACAGLRLRSLALHFLLILDLFARRALRFFCRVCACSALALVA